MALQLILIFWVVGNPALSLSWPVTWARRSGMVHRGLWNEMQETLYVLKSLL